MAEELKPIDGVEAAIETIGGNRAVASSTSLEPLWRNLRRTGLAGCSSRISIPRRRSHAASRRRMCFSLLQARSGDPHHAVVIEDSVAGVTAARRAGMR